MSHIKMLDNGKAAIINEFHHPKSKGYCSKCGDQLFIRSFKELKAECQNLIDSITPGISYIPAVTVNNPKDWDYEMLCIVTGNAMTGAGSLSDIDHSVSENLEEKPNSLHNKLKAEERLGFFRLRKETLDCGGNAIVDVRFNYTRFGADQILVSMAGTAVKLKNTHILGDMIAQRLTNLAIYNNRYLYLKKLKDRVEQN